MGTPTAPFQIIAGPADVFLAPTGTAMPAVNAAMPTGAWVALGKTRGGVSVKHTQQVDLLSADQNTGPIKAIRSAEGLDVSFALIELTQDTVALISNAVTVTSVAGPPADKDFPIHKGRNVDVRALLIRADSAYGNFFMQFEVPKVVMTDAPQWDFKENDMAALQCTYTALEDLTAGESARFGTIRSQTS